MGGKRRVEGSVLDRFEDFFLEQFVDFALLDDRLDHRAQVAGEAADQLNAAVFHVRFAAAQTLHLETWKWGNERTESVLKNGFHVEILSSEFVEKRI